MPELSDASAWALLPRTVVENALATLRVVAELPSLPASLLNAARNAAGELRDPAPAEQAPLTYRHTGTVELYELGDDIATTPFYREEVYGKPPTDYLEFFRGRTIPGLRNWTPYNTAPSSLPGWEGALEIGFYAGATLSDEAVKKTFLLRFVPLGPLQGPVLNPRKFVGVVTLELLDGTVYRENVYDFYDVLISMARLGYKAAPTYGDLRSLTYREGSRTWDLTLVKPVPQSGTITYDPEASPVRPTRLLTLYSKDKAVWESTLGDVEEVTPTSFQHFLNLSNNRYDGVATVTRLSDDPSLELYDVTLVKDDEYGEASTTLRAKVHAEVR